MSRVSYASCMRDLLIERDGGENNYVVMGMDDIVNDCYRRRHSMGTTTSYEKYEIRRVRNQSVMNALYRSEMFEHQKHGTYTHKYMLKEKYR